MFRSIFGGRKRKRASGGKAEAEESIRSAGVGDVVVVGGFSPTFEDAYFLVEQKNRYESPFGKWFELIAAEGERRVSIEWSENGEFFIAVTEQDRPMGLASIGLDEADLVRLDEEQSIDNHIVYEGGRHLYRNSYQAGFFKDGGQDGEGFYLWEFSSEEGDSIVSVAKWEGMPFEVYASVAVSPDVVTVYNK